MAKSFETVRARRPERMESARPERWKRLHNSSQHGAYRQQGASPLSPKSAPPCTRPPVGLGPCSPAEPLAAKTEVAVADTGCERQSALLRLSGRVVPVLHQRNCA